MINGDFWHWGVDGELHMLEFNTDDRGTVVEAPRCFFTEAQFQAAVKVRWPKQAIRFVGTALKWYAHIAPAGGA